MSRLLLASTSPWRGELLERLGLPFEQVDPDLDEEPWKGRGLSVEDLVTQLAVAKASALADRAPDAFILGADQVAELDGDVLGKPGTAGRAVEQLSRLAGRTHRLVTGLALLCPDGSVRTALDVHEVTLRALTRPQIEHYVQRDQPLACAGSYKLESLGIALLQRCRGDDYTAVIGLPLTQVVRLLAESGWDPLDRAPGG